LQGKKEQAREMFRQALRYDPTNYNARANLADLENEAGNYKASVETAGPIVTQLRQSPEGLMLLAKDYAGLQDKDSIRALASDWKGLPAVATDLSIEFASLLVKTGLAREAIEILDKAKSADPDSDRLNLTLGDCYLSAGELSKASASYEAALSVKQGCVPCLQGLARIADQEGNTEKALSYLIKARHIEPENPDVLFEFGKVCLERDLVEDALTALKKAAALRPEQDSYVYVLASAHVGNKQYAQARSLLAGLVDKHPDDAVLNYALGAVLYLELNLTAAEGYLKKSIQLRPDQLPAYYYLGLIEEKNGNNDRAIETFRDILRRHPDHAMTYEALGAVQVKQKMYPEAQAALEKAIALDPGSVKAHYQLGMLFARIGKQTESNAQLEIAHKIETERTHEPRLRLLTPE
jgi:superkiller protein 3